MNQGFGVSIAYTGPHRKPDAEESLQAKYLSLDDLAGSSDYISIHTPGAETAGLIQAEHLSMMKETVLLVNTATPTIVDGEALIEAAEKGSIRGLAMDGMYSDEKLAAKFLELPEERILVTPRAAWLTDDSYNRMSDMAVASIEDYALGAAVIRHQVL